MEVPRQCLWYSSGGRMPTNFVFQNKTQVVGSMYLHPDEAVYSCGLCSVVILV